MNAQAPIQPLQYTKFSPVTVVAKKNIKGIRRGRGHSMNESAFLLGVSRKQLEDIETLRNYGCHLDLEIITKICVVYDISAEDLTGCLPAEVHSTFFERPRKRVGSSSRN